MDKTHSGTRYTPEVRARAVRMVFEHEADYSSRSAAIKSISQKIGCGRDTLRKWVNSQEIESDERAGLTQSDRDKIKSLERENKELRRANEILKKHQHILPRRSSTAHSRNDGFCGQPL